MTKNLQESEQVMKKAIIENLPKKFLDYDFKGMIESPANKSFIEFCKINYCNHRTNKKSLVFCGTIGSGKTRLAVATLKNIKPLYKKALVEHYSGDRPVESYFIAADILFDKINEAVKQNGKEKFFKDLFARYDIILIDDLSFFNFTTAKQENLYLFVNEAYLNEKAIMITMNFALEDLKKADPRVYDRLREMAIIMEFKGKSFRK